MPPSTPPTTVDRRCQRRSGWCACDTSDRWSPASSARRTSEAIANGEHRHPRREDRPAQPPATGKGRHRQAAQQIERADVSRDRVAEATAELGREDHAERSAERRGGKECDSTCRSRGWAVNEKKKLYTNYKTT